MELHRWQCDKCPHTFELTWKDVHEGMHCPVCTNTALCGFERCDYCVARSIAVHHRSMSFLAANRGVNMLTIPRLSEKDFQWLCFECDDTFTASCADVTTDGVWCKCRDKKPTR